MSEGESNCNNAILHCVPESASNNQSERQAHDLEKLKIILRGLGLSDSIKAEYRKDIKFIRRIGEKRQQQEARPLKVGFNFYSRRERLIELARYLNEIPDLH